ncbi:MAG: C1 family peptidase [Acidobacteriota bacterium]
MKKFLKVLLIFSMIFTFMFISINGQNKVVYKKKTKFPVLDSIEKAREKSADEKSKVTNEINKKNKKLAETEEKHEWDLSTDLKGVFAPASIKDFKSVFHFKPVAQYYTSTCWSFSATSFYESEIYRLYGKKVKLSEMWTAYYELIEKAQRYIEERGNSFVSGGGETNGVNRIWRKYGIVPAEAYTGLTDKNMKHDHIPLMNELEQYLEYVKQNNLWNAEENIEHIKLILNKHIGTPPGSFIYEGEKYDPKTFMKNVVKLNMDDYCSVMSTKYFPFYTKQEFKVPDNWWHNKDYINLPLNDWYDVVRKSIKSGYSIVIGGDVSEPGKVGPADISFIPSFDIPNRYINQDSREYRIYNKTTDDDHGIHLVGYKKKAGKDWFLIKDSGRSARLGKFKGYYFFRGDFVKLKMLTFTVHKDMLKQIILKIK